MPQPGLGFSLLTWAAARARRRLGFSRLPGLWSPWLSGFARLTRAAVQLLLPQSLPTGPRPSRLSSYSPPFTHLYQGSAQASLPGPLTASEPRSGQASLASCGPAFGGLRWAEGEAHWQAAVALALRISLARAAFKLLHCLGQGK